MAVSLGIYLPLNASVPVVIGGLLSYLVNRSLHRRKQAIDKEEHRFRVGDGLQNALMLCCGLVAGSTLVGVILAVPFAIKQSADALRIMPASAKDVASVISIFVTVYLCYWIYRVARRSA